MSFYLNIVCKNIVCDVGLNVNFSHTSQVDFPTTSMYFFITSGVNFINVLHTAFKRADPESVKRY